MYVRGWPGCARASPPELFLHTCNPSKRGEFSCDVIVYMSEYFNVKVVIEMVAIITIIITEGYTTCNETGNNITARPSFSVN